METVRISDISDDTVLCIESSSGHLECMTKQDFLTSPYYLDRADDPCEVNIGEKSVVSIDLDYIIEMNRDEMHEDWDEDVRNDVEASKVDFELFFAELNRIFSENPTYYPGDFVSLD